jgi:hypothetical protein
MSGPAWLHDTGPAGERAATIPADRAALMARMAELVGVLTYPEVVELRSLLDAMARAHGARYAVR